MTRAISRRGFLVTCLVTAGGACLYLLLSDTSAPGGTKEILVKLSGNFRDLTSVRLVGEEYLKQVPEENDLDRLLELLGPELSSGALRRDVKEDYRHSRLVKLKGWLISISEARIYAVVAISRPTSGSTG